MTAATSAKDAALFLPPESVIGREAHAVLKANNVALLKVAEDAAAYARETTQQIRVSRSVNLPPQFV